MQTLETLSGPASVGPSPPGRRLVVTAIFVVYVGFLTWMLEETAVRSDREFGGVRALVVSLAPEQVASLAGLRLVHVQGKATAEGWLADPDTGVRVKGLALERHVDVWSEGTGWTSSLGFPWNTAPKLLLDYRHWTARTRIGPMPVNIVSKLRVENKLRLTPENFEGGSVRPPLANRLFLVGDELHTAKNPLQPQPGDLRIRYELVPEGTLTILAGHDGSGFRIFPANNFPLELIYEGTYTPEQMLASVGGADHSLVWLARLLLALALVFHVLRTGVKEHRTNAGYLFLTWGACLFAMWWPESPLTGLPQLAIGVAFLFSSR